MYDMKQKEISKLLSKDMVIKEINCDTMIDDISICLINQFKKIYITFKECYRFKIWKDINQSNFVYEDITISQLKNNITDLYVCDLQGKNIHISIRCKDILMELEE